MPTTDDSRAIVRALLALAACAAPLHPLHAQASPPTVDVDARVRLELSSQRERIRGTVVALVPDTLVIQTGQWREGASAPVQLRVPVDLIRRAEIQTGTEPRATAAVRVGLIGGIGAAIVGAVAAAAYWQSVDLSDDIRSDVGTSQDTYRRRTIRRGARIGAFIGVTVGGIAGSMTPRARWRTVSLQLPGGRTPTR